MKSNLQIPDSIKLIEQKQIATLSPADRDKYYDKVILDILHANPEGATAPEIEEITGFYGRTIRDHLKKLVARGEVTSISRGKLTLYFPNGEIIGKPHTIESKARPGTVYVVNKIENANGRFFYIQEKELDAYRTLRVKGGITIPQNDIKEFIKRLHTYCMQGEEHHE